MTDAFHLPWADLALETIPDTVLLARYVADRDGAAFAVLVRRHGPLVLGVCLRNAGHRQDAEDAFQAVFLLLAKQAAALSHPERLANWLYGVAVRVGRKARRSAVRRRTHEAKAVPPPDVPPSDWPDVAPVLDDELLRLSDDHRAAVVLCDLQGLSRTDAAVRLGIPEGTLSSRLNAARKKLAERLAKRGVTLSTGVLALHATAAVSEELVGKVATALTAFHGDGALPAPLAELLTEGAFPMRMKIAAAVLMFGLGSVGVVAAWPDGQPLPKQDAKLKADPPKPDEPKSEFNRPPRDKRLRMVGNFEADTALNRPFWSADGKSVLAWASDTGPKDARINTSAVVAGVRISGWAFPSEVVGLCEDGSTYVVFTQGSGINGISLLTAWDFEQLLDEKSKKKWETELEKEDGVPLAISPDGKRLFTKPVPGTKAVGGGRSNVRLLEARTGNPIREVVTSSDEKSGPVHVAFSADTARVYLTYRTPKGFTLRALDTADSKPAWERTVEGVFLPDNAAYRQLLARGGLLALTVSGTEEPDAPNLLRLFDAATGKDGTTLLDQGNHGGYARTISHDGKFLVGMAEDHEVVERPSGGFGGFQPGGGGGAQPKKGNPRPGVGQPGGGGGWPSGPTSVRAKYSLVAWDLNTGKRVRTWDLPTGSHPDVAFAPDRPLLAIADHKQVFQGPDKAYRQTTNLGFWDFSGLTK